MSSISSRISTKLQTLNPSFLEIINNSAKHRHHTAMQNENYTGESHFKLRIVSESFKDLKLIARHRLVNEILKEEFKVIHALELELKTVDEIAKKIV